MAAASGAAGVFVESVQDEGAGLWRRWGKTDACAAMVLAAIYDGPPSRHFLVAPTQDQAAILFDRVVEMLDAAADLFPKYKLRGTPYPKLRIGDHVVSARSGHQPRSLRGYGATHVIVDEAAYLSEHLMTDVLWPMLATTDGSFTLLSTPHGMNAFWRFFLMGQAGEHGVWSRQAPSSENPHVTERFLAMQRSLLSERSYAVEYEAKFMEMDGAVFLTEVVESATRLPTGEARGPFSIGIDWARSSDYSAIAIVSGSQLDAELVEVRRLPRAPWVVQFRVLQEVLNRYPAAQVTCDATGMGGPVVEWLNTDLATHGIKPFVFTTATKDKVIGELVAGFEKGRLRIPPEPELLREIAHYESSDSKSMGARSGYHDDLVCALALAYFHAPRFLGAPIRLGDSRTR